MAAIHGLEDLFNQARSAFDLVKKNKDASDPLVQLWAAAIDVLEVEAAQAATPMLSLDLDAVDQQLAQCARGLLKVARVFAGERREGPAMLVRGSEMRHLKANSPANSPQIRANWPLRQRGNSL